VIVVVFLVVLTTLYSDLAEPSEDSSRIIATINRVVALFIGFMLIRYIMHFQNKQ